MHDQAQQSEQRAARAGIIQMRSADNVPLTDATVGRVLADAARRSLGTSITETYLDNVFVGFNTMHSKLDEASSGATKLANGADQLHDGTKQLRSGSAQLSTGLHELNAGSNQLASGADQVSSGAAQLATGARQLDTGASSLSGGLNRLQTATAALPSQTRQLADGSRQVADGTQRVADVVTPASNAIITAIDRSPDATDSVVQVQSLAKSCDGNPTFCSQLRSAAARAGSDAKHLDSMKSEVRGKAASTRSDVTRLNNGAHEVAAGNARLASAAGQLTSGISQAATGARQLATGASQLDTGAQRLATGSAQGARGAHTLSTNIAKASAGADQLATGAAKADDGAAKLAKGNRQLADGLAKALKDVPTYTADERDHLKQVVAAPVASSVIGTDGYTNSAIALFAALALWVAALVAFALLRAMPHRITTSDLPGWLLALRGIAPGAILGAAQAVVVALVVVIATDAGPGRFLLVLVAALLSAATFMVLNRALVAAWGAAGRTVSILVGTLALATSVTSAQPGVLQTLGAVLPTAPAIAMLRQAVGGHVAQTFVSMVPLLIWLALGAIATLILTERARAVAPHDLRPETTPPARHARPRTFPWSARAEGSTR